MYFVLGKFQRSASLPTVEETKGHLQSDRVNSSSREHSPRQYLVALSLGHAASELEIGQRVGGWSPRAERVAEPFTLTGPRRSSDKAKMWIQIRCFLFGTFFEWKPLKWKILVWECNYLFKKKHKGNFHVIKFQTKEAAGISNHTWLEESNRPRADGFPHSAL